MAPSKRSAAQPAGGACKRPAQAENSRPVGPPAPEAAPPAKGSGLEGSHEAVAAEEAREDAAAAFELFSRDLDDSAHGRMVADEARTGAYERAVARAVKGRAVLDVGTGPNALLALLCARAGASRVIAVEVVPAAAELAKHAIAEAGFADTIEVIEGYSTAVELPRVDIVVHEIVGNLATEEGVAATLADLQARSQVVDSSQAGWSLPRRVETLVAPVNLNVALPEVVAPELPPNPAVRLPFAPPPATLLGDPQPFEVVDAEAPVVLQQARVLHWRVRAASRLSGFACAPRLELDGREEVSAWTARTHWSHILVRLQRPTAVEAGDEVELTVHSDLRRFPVSHVFEAALLRHPAEGAGAGTPQTPRRRSLGRMEVQLQ